VLTIGFVVIGALTYGVIEAVGAAHNDLQDVLTELKSIESSLRQSNFEKQLWDIEKAIKQLSK